MTHLRFAEYQIRLLLCTPAGRRGGGFYWKCGCAATPCAYRKFDVAPCPEHGPLLCEVQEDEEPAYDYVSAPRLQNPIAQSA